MCSNIWARPVLPIGSCTEPASTWVKKENTGTSGRSRMTTVRPLGRVLTVVRFSKEATSWAAATAVNKRIKTRVRMAAFFIGPPRQVGMVWRLASRDRAETGKNPQYVGGKGMSNGGRWSLAVGPRQNKRLPAPAGGHRNKDRSYTW